MYCTNCGTKMAPSNLHCSNCGKRTAAATNQTQISKKPIVVGLIVLLTLIAITLFIVYINNSLAQARQDGLNSVIQLDMDELGEFADNFVADCIASGGSYDESTATCNP